MKGAIGSLVWVTLAFVGGLIVLVAFGQCNDGATTLPCGITLGVLFLLTIVGSSLSALILGITACRLARRSRRWGWFGAFLSLSVVVGLGVFVFFLEVPNSLLPAFLRILPLVAPPLALVAAAFIYRREET